MRRALGDSVVVITGASSGIGKATAHALAEHGASVVLAARSEQSLRETTDECEAAGGRALAVPTDVTDKEAVQDLARQAADHFGRIDVWVNNAGVMAYGYFEQIPDETYRQMIETNLFGAVNGARAALPYFREQGSGILINISSLWGRMFSPYVSAYTTSVGSSASAYGYTLTIWSTGVVLSYAYGPPSPPLVFYFFSGAVLGFAVVGVLAFGGVTVEFDAESNRVQLWGSFRFLSVGLAVGAAWFLSAHASSLPGWPLGAFVATTTYLVVVGAENTAADRRTQEEG